MNPVNSNILIGKKDAAFFAANPTLVLLDGQLLYNENTGELFIGDGVTQLNALSPINSGFTPSGTNTQYIAGDGSYINFPTDVSFFNNDAGYLDSGDIGVSVQPYDSNTTLLGNGTAGDEIVLTTSSNQLTSLGLNAGESIRRNALNTAYEGFTALTSGDIGVTVQGYSANTTLLGNSTTGSGNIVLSTSPTISTSLRVTAGSSTSFIRDLVSTPTAGAIYLNQSSPSISNYTLMDDTSSLYLNGRASNSIYIQSNTSNIVRFGPSFQIHTPIASASGSFTTFTFTKPNNTTQTASANIQGFLFTTGSRQWNTGAITTQQEILITSPTYSFTGASTITDAYSLFVNAPTAGTNATITNRYAAGFSGGVEINGQVNIIGGTTLLLQNTSGLNIQNVGSDRKISSSRTGGNTIFVNHTTTQFIFQNFDTTTNLFGFNTSTGQLQVFGGMIIADAKDIALNTTTGTKIGTGTTQKIGFWNATPIVQPTTAVAAATFVANAGTAVNDASTFDGYTVGQVVKALRNTGLLA